MKVCYLAAAAALSVSTAAFAAGNGEALFDEHNCGACHSPVGKSVGPSVMEIANKYKGDKNAQAKLEAKTRNGGAGAFGNIPMPATTSSVSDGDIKTMVAWLLMRR